MNKRMSILFIFMLAFQTISSSFILPAQINAEGASKNVLVIGDVKDKETGKTVSIDEVEGELAVKVDVNWVVDDKGVESEYTERLQLDSNLLIKDLQTKDIGIGTIDVTTEGIVSLIVSEEIEEDSNANGSVFLDAVVEGLEVVEELAETEVEEATTEIDFKIAAMNLGEPEVSVAGVEIAEAREITEKMKPHLKMVS